MTGNGDAFQPGFVDSQHFFHVFRHAHAEETVRVGGLHLLKIGVLVAVDDFLHHNRSSHLSVVHV